MCHFLLFSFGLCDHRHKKTSKSVLFNDFRLCSHVLKRGIGKTGEKERQVIFRDNLECCRLPYPFGEGNVGDHKSAKEVEEASPTTIDSP